MKIGFVSLWWLPHCGGGEVYAYRLARAMQRAGIAIEVITTSPAVSDRDNGDIEVLRTGVFHEPQSMNAFRHYLRGPDHAAWCDDVARWAEERRFTHILCNAPLMRRLSANQRCASALAGVSLIAVRAASIACG